MSLAPVGESERIRSLDVMRGFAVLGILTVNAPFFAAPWQTAVNPLLPPLDVTPQTLWSWFVVHVFFEYKCITLFSMLFGASIYLVGGERSDKARGALLHRRLSWLLVFGLIHGTLIWYGDILVTYALTGFLVSVSALLAGADAADGRRLPAWCYACLRRVGNFHISSLAGGCAGGNESADLGADR